MTEHVAMLIYKMEKQGKKGPYWSLKFNEGDNEFWLNYFSSAGANLTVDLEYRFTTKKQGDFENIEGEVVLAVPTETVLDTEMVLDAQPNIVPRMGEFPDALSYNDQKRLEIFAGQCLNISAQRHRELGEDADWWDKVFTFAKVGFKKGMQEKWLDVPKQL